MPTKFSDPKRRKFRKFFGAEEAAIPAPCNDDEPKNAEIMFFKRIGFDFHQIKRTLKIKKTEICTLVNDVRPRK